MWKRQMVTCHVSIPVMTLTMTVLVLACVCREGAGAIFKRDVAASEPSSVLQEVIATTNINTKPNPPAKFIVWFRNETTLAVLCHPSFPPAIFTNYKVSIAPPDASESEVYVEKDSLADETELGPAQAMFNGLVPGRVYNISVQTVFESDTSEPITGQYRTVPLRPSNVTAIDLNETDLGVTWLPPTNYTEFDSYKVIVTGKSGDMPTIIQPRDAPSYLLIEDLQPGARYTVTVKTISGKVTSWPATTEVTLQPLPVQELKWDGESVQWKPAPNSDQEEYRVTWEITAPLPSEEKSSLTTKGTSAQLKPLLPGRDYNVSVKAISRGVASEPVSVGVVIPPLQPRLAV